MTPERLEELHEAAKYANSHGNGQVSLKATELLEVLPALPVEEKAAEPTGTVTAEDVQATSEVDLGTGQAAEILQPAVPAVEEKSTDGV